MQTISTLLKINSYVEVDPTLEYEFSFITLYTIFVYE